MTETDVEVVTKVKIDTDIKPPTRYSVVYLNDDKTSANFVAQSLIDVFGYSIDEALAKTKEIDEHGSGEVTSGLARELATHLRDVVIMRARTENFPLVVEIKEEE
jgi:ATP-dependent Clp protease adapter protein ClpS